MARLRLGSCLLLFCVGVLVSPAFAQTDGEASLEGEITGTLTFFGCAPDPSDFEIRGVPLLVESDRNPAGGGRLDLPAVQGFLSPTDDPHRFVVSLPAVQVGVPYQLRIASVPPSPCGRVFWEGSEQGIAFAGVPVELRGYAPRSRIEVLGTQPAGAPRRGWVGAETLDVQDLAHATRQLRWATDLPGVTRGVIQVATEEFPKETPPGRSCASASGVIYQRGFRARSGVWNMLPPLNFAAIAASVAFSGPNGIARYNLFSYGAPLYVRVLPVTGRTVRCDAVADGPAPWVVLANAAKRGGTRIYFGADPPGPPPPAPIELTSATHYSPPWFWDHPKPGETAYRVVHEHPIPQDIFTNFPGAYLQDPWAFQFAKFTDFDPGDTIPVGYRFWFKKGSDGFDIGDVFEGAVSIVTGVVDAVGFVVNQVSKAYESIKKAAAQVVTSAISATGLVDCEASELCRQVVETAIESGLAAAGMPPSLPNWDAVVDQGFEYFAAEVVTQAGVGAVPGAQDLTETAAKKLVAEAAKQMNDNRGGGGGLPRWLTLDLGQDPAILTLELSTYGSITAPLFPNHLLVRPSSTLLGSGVDVPGHWRETNTLDRVLSIPIVLRPDLDGFVPPVGAFNQKLPDYLVGIAAKSWWKGQLSGISCVESENLFRLKLGPLLVASTYTLPSLAFDPDGATAFPPYGACTP